jgi:hypothetical protein
MSEPSQYGQRSVLVPIMFGVRDALREMRREVRCVVRGVYAMVFFSSWHGVDVVARAEHTDIAGVVFGVGVCVDHEYGGVVATRVLRRSRGVSEKQGGFSGAVPEGGVRPEGGVLASE